MANTKELGWVEIGRAETPATATLFASAPELLNALRGLTKEISLSKLNVRKDFSLMNAHACALKLIHKLEQ